MLSVMPGNHSRIVKWAALSSVALLLSACGGGGGGGGFVPRTPPPPVSPTPTPTPPPVSTASISAPARATTAPGVAPKLANASEPNFTMGAAEGTTFPLLQTSLTLDGTSIKPEAAINSAGGTALVTAQGLTISAGGFQNVPSWSDPNFDWTRAGWWALHVEPGAWDYGGAVDYRGVFVAGYETPASSMPATGSATYIGAAHGSMFHPASTSNGCGCGELSLGGLATFTADFGARRLSGTLTDMAILGWDDVIGPWNDVAFSATVAGNGFTGTAHVTSAPPGTMGMNATGTLEGKFFGPSAQEAGAVWTLFDGTNAAIGTLSGRQTTCGWQGEC